MRKIVTRELVIPRKLVTPPQMTGGKVRMFMNIGAWLRP
jgi:hypothetical protein